MCSGRIVELADQETLFRAPAYPYTRALLDALPQIEAGQRRAAPLAGDLPSPCAPQPGCIFHTRCPPAVAACRIDRPDPRAVGRNHAVACHLPA